MGVYINMEKPKECGHCDMFIEHNSICHCYLTGSHITFVGEVADDCPLTEIDLVRCGECKYFNLNEWDETICGVPIIVAHEICHKWGDGCKTNIYGFCFMGERRADEDI